MSESTESDRLRQVTGMKGTGNNAHGKQTRQHIKELVKDKSRFEKALGREMYLDGESRREFWVAG